MYGNIAGRCIQVGRYINMRFQFEFIPQFIKTIFEEWCMLKVSEHKFDFSGRWLCDIKKSKWIRAEVNPKPLASGKHIGSTGKRFVEKIPVNMNTVEPESEGKKNPELKKKEKKKRGKTAWKCHAIIQNELFKLTRTVLLSFEIYAVDDYFVFT